MKVVVLDLAVGVSILCCSDWGVAQPAPVRPYNLDQLISDRAKAEADLDSMMSEMRGRMKAR
jgi:hypothetical protein